MKMDIKRILCPTDFSESADYALNYAVTIAQRHGAVLELLHVTQSSAYADDVVNEKGQRYEDEMVEQLQARVRNMREMDVDIGINVVSGTAYVEIVNRANAWPADMIVIGTHGRTGMKHLLIGSVAERVIRMASCPVCSVRHPEHVLTETAGESRN